MKRKSPISGKVEKETYYTLKLSFGSLPPKKHCEIMSFKMFQALDLVSSKMVTCKKFKNCSIIDGLTTLHCYFWDFVLRLVLNCGTFKLVYDSDQDILWAGAADGKKKDTFEAKGPLELFGFGSGDFLEGPDAKDVQQDLTGRWLTFKLESGSEHCILEADRRLPDHVKKMDIFGKASQCYPCMFFVHFCAFHDEFSL